MKDKESALSIFIDSAMKQAKATEEGDYGIGNNSYDQIVLVAKYLKENSLLQELQSLLNHENIGVKIWAATYLLETKEEKAKNVLSEIIQMNVPHHSFTAEITLEEWNSGNLKLQY